MKPLSAQTHYEVLEVEPSATAETIDAAWRKLRRLLGPGSIATYSLVDPGEQQALLLRLDEARAALVDPAQRRAYDRSLGIDVPEPESVPSVADAAPPVAEVAMQLVEGVVIEAGHEDDDVLELELDDEDVLEVFEATPGPVFGLVLHSRASPGFRAESAVVQHAATDTAAIEGSEPGSDLAAATDAAAIEVSEPGSALVAADDASVIDEAQPAEPQPPVVDGATRFSGGLLRELREASGLSLAEFSARTRIGVHHLTRVEEEAWSSLPERVFLRGILGNYARELRLDANQVVESYLARRPR